ncbi:hypothetical protein MAJHIDBO_01146 [Propionibacterium freudenreichii subsp. shermanii]|nr:hypothetical protein MAJHIDBO_01146 [Propionibacterium freudenreichii subsp. shermanii]SPS08941.1 hypothetical protein MAJHIDBO_01146 [Propionibacterium freudenreichii subsp. shermanii]
MGGIEIEAQVAGLVVRPGLGGRGSHQFAQRRMDDVRCRVGLACTLAVHCVNHRLHLITGAQLAAGAHGVHHEAGDRTLDVDDLEFARVRPQHASIGILTAHLGVEGGLLEDDLAKLPGPQVVDHVAVRDESADPGRDGQLGIAHEGCLTTVAQFAIALGVLQIALLRLRVGLGACLLLVHQRAEGGLIDVQALLGGHLEGEVDGETVGVMQLEGLVAAQFVGTRRTCLGHCHVEQLGARVERALEALRLVVGDVLDALPLVVDLGVGGMHALTTDVEQFGERDLLDPQQPHGADRAAHQASQDIAAGLIARGHPVGHQHQGGTHVVAHHAQTHVVGVIGAVALAGHRGGPLDHREDLVGLVHVVHALHEQGDALEAGAGVDVAGLHRPGDVEILLGAHGAELLGLEDQVPDLQEAILVGLRAALGAVLGATVDVDLGTGATRAGNAHVPVVVLQSTALDVLGRHAQ